MKTGFTFSHRHTTWLGLHVPASLRTVLDWQPDLIRLAAYWDEIETQPGTYDFSQLRQLLEICEHSPAAVVLTVGVKAPRWPEFYFPTHLKPDLKPNLKSDLKPNLKPDLTHLQTRQALLDFVAHTVRELGEYQCIKYWQIENEPLDPSGPEALTVPLDLLSVESALVRRYSDRPQIITLWGNDLAERQLWPLAETVGDIIGIDLYYRQFVSVDFNLLGGSREWYRGPTRDGAELAALLATIPRPIWITELQAEPWERDEAGYKSAQPGSISPSLLSEYDRAARALPVAAILYWGVEYWLWRAAQGDTRYVEWFKNKMPSI